ncbi:hypothetical protein [Leptolyngbya sp. FACHB-16]|uniref:hypothetical protein n=1 Tax=unclassified Leptolyngbya TaxID=2650499 RepID=UPI0016828CD3|nr:hypothetical protein [Leptolyngbya sp. FACHB-16]MBD2156758.1 hypothetical protein [Leptolyngbya sp. FACHB-16]
MKTVTVSILLQGEGITDIQVVNLEPGKRGTDVLDIASRYRKGTFEGEFLVFEEDAENPLNSQAALPKNEAGKPLRLHVHRCRALAVEVSFNGEVQNRRFGPGTTIQTVKQWAAIKAFEMTKADAAEHVLQISGTTTRPEPDTHIGSLVTGTGCQLRFDLVPLKRVEG